MTPGSRSCAAMPSSSAFAIAVATWVSKPSSSASWRRHSMGWRPRSTRRRGRSDQPSPAATASTGSQRAPTDRRTPASIACDRPRRARAPAPPGRRRAGARRRHRPRARRAPTWAGTARARPARRDASRARTGGSRSAERRARRDCCAPTVALMIARPPPGSAQVSNIGPTTTGRPLACEPEVPLEVSFAHGPVSREQRRRRHREQTRAACHGRVPRRSRAAPPRRRPGRAAGFRTGRRCR